jgi:hypothetical protein
VFGCIEKTNKPHQISKNMKKCKALNFCLFATSKAVINITTQATMKKNSNKVI